MPRGILHCVQDDNRAVPRGILHCDRFGAATYWQVLLTQLCPLAQSDCCVHIGFASVESRQTPSCPQYAMRASMSAHCMLVVQVYSQKPLTHSWFESHVEELVHSGWGRVSGTHAPWLQ